MKSFAHHKEDGKGKRKAKGLHDNILNPYNLHLPKYKTVQKGSYIKMQKKDNW